jgi:hypothetical protein
MRPLPALHPALGVNDLAAGQMEKELACRHEARKDATGGSASGPVRPKAGVDPPFAAKGVTRTRLILDRDDVLDQSTNQLA